MPTVDTANDLSRKVQELERELAEARRQQAGTSDILHIIMGSAPDATRVFDAIARSAARLCDAFDAIVLRVDGDTLRPVAHHGPMPAGDVALHRGTLGGRTVMERRLIHIEDLQNEVGEFPEGGALARERGHRSALSVPLLKDGAAIGNIQVRRNEVRPFSDQQISLLKTFADQAVIAIENSRLFEAEQESKRELQEALEHQTATGEILQVISSSPGHLQPVYEEMLRKALRHCDAKFGGLFRYENDLFRGVSGIGVPEGLVFGVDRSALDPSANSDLMSLITNRKPIHTADLQLSASYLAGDPFIVGAVERGGARAALIVPLVKENNLIGVFAIYRQEVRPFTDKQIKLLENFAGQAVIAIENTRLLNELRESLQQQTATADVLKVISRAVFDLPRVLDTLVESAAILCDSYDTAILQKDGDVLRIVSHRGHIPSIGRAGTVPLARGAAVWRAILDRQTIHLADVQSETNEYPESSAIARRLGYHTMLAVPLIRAGEAIGAIVSRRTEVRLFTDRQVELLRTFADQAVIAIENTRLFEAEQASKRELQESLQQQTATADVLKAISRATFDLPKVLDTLVESAANLCDSYDTAIVQRDGDALRIVAHRGHIPSVGPVGVGTLPLTRGATVGRSVLDQQTIHLADAQSQMQEYPEGSAIAKRLGFRTLLTVPLIGAGESLGAITLRRAEVRPFSDRQIELLQTFADQAVIAIENARLMEELQARTRELVKTVEDLEVASQHKSQFVANMSHELRTPLAAILGYAELTQEGFYGPLPEKSLDALSRIRSNGKHLLGLINTVLDIAKIESGQFTLNIAEYVLEGVVETVRSATESLAQNKKLAFKTEVAKSLPVGLGDEQRLTQVLLNLVGNAIKFTDTGEVRVTAKAVDGRFNVSVTDTGPGIPDDERTRIFEQFHQVDSSLTKAAGGTGLGLAIAKQIVEMHGGRIWVESTIGEGSTFHMEIPTRAEFRQRAG